MWTLRRPSSILGSSDGLMGSTAIFMRDLVLNLRGRKMKTSSVMAGSTRVAVLVTGASTPSMRTQLPAGTRETSRA